jgi:hypothetical protein
MRLLETKPVLQEAFTLMLQKLCLAVILLPVLALLHYALMAPVRHL